MIASLPFTVEDANSIIYGARAGLLHEALALVAIKSTRPQPIVNAFGNDDSNRLNLSRYFPLVDPKDPSSVAVAHLAAYIYCYMNWNSIRRKEMKDHFAHATGGKSISSPFFSEYSAKHVDNFGFHVGSWTPKMDKVLGDWCREHFLNPSSVKS